MKNDRLGCLTGAGIVATLLSIILIAAAFFMSGLQMFNPGPLNAEAGAVLNGVTAHAQIKDCGACHAAAWGSTGMAERCAACHTGITAQLTDEKQLHGAIAKQDPSLSCRSCHPEHRGPAAKLTVLGDHPFPHDVTGFSLKAHKLTAGRKPFACADCHAQDITTFQPDVCTQCHVQLDADFMAAHKKAYGSACLDCHDGLDRFHKPFEHSKFVFQLTGRHADQDCAGCHSGALKLADFASAPRDCHSCHAKDDPHKGSLGTACQDCHSASGWKDVTFDHNKAPFKLENSHASVKCEQCHKTSAFKDTPTDCFSCHKAQDNHDGKFGTDCSACHTTTAWKDVTFDHNKSAFPLTGAHASVDCTSCHKNAVFSGLDPACVSCHADPGFHSGMFGTNCASCHSTSNWSAAYHGPHPGIASEGGSGVHHGGASCRTCHVSTLHAAVCTACHSGNNGGGGGND